MEKESTHHRASSLIKSVIAESKKIRAERGEDFFSNKKGDVEVAPQQAAKIHPSDGSLEKNFRSIRDTHVKLNHLILEYDQKIFDKNNQVLKSKKTRSKSVHLYIDETVEHFLKTERAKAHTKWGLRKNAGTGQLLQKFIGNFIELKKREARQLDKIKKILADFKIFLVEFKKSSVSPDEYLKAERANQKMRDLSNDLRILLSLLEFETEDLKKELGGDEYGWVEFVLKWKLYS